ncbi:hypothetical protein ACFFV7_32245 [Nonomuraea spiralis]|uniref:CdiI immunity protein domain-containing protein n=1 Tax=Nonomuraea spiralis TaxID=46182 RepID=A0ABV5IQ50_9ACTN|nr:hypothetical protein [Nonomuraea spiralis]GGT38600.1 hypothetical protein GCM10010176_098310 [Nonomuraea spiralis]
MDFETVLKELYPWYEDDVRAKLFALMCDVAFVYASTDEDFDVSLDCALDAIAENVQEMRAEYRLNPLSLLLSAVGGPEGGVNTDSAMVTSEP